MPIISFDAKKWSGRSYGAGEKYWRCRSMSFDVAAGRVPAVLRAGRLLGAAARVHAGIPGQLRGQRTTSVPPGNAFNSSCLIVCFFVFAVSLPDPSSNTSACVVRPRSRMLMTDRFRRGTLRSASWLVVRAVCFLFCFQIVDRDQRGRKCFFFLPGRRRISMISTFIPRRIEWTTSTSRSTASINTWNSSTPSAKPRASANGYWNESNTNTLFLRANRFLSLQVHWWHDWIDAFWKFCDR